MANNIDRPNIASAEDQAQFVKSIESVEREIATMTGEFMKAVKVRRNEIKDILEDAKNKGVPKASLKAAVKARGLQRKLEAVREELEDNELQIFVSIREALGDYASLPLGAAAVQKDEQDPTTAAIVAAVSATEEPAEKPDFSAERARDAEAFKEPEKPAGLDPAAARRNRAKKTADKYDKKADEGSTEPAKGEPKAAPTPELVGAQPGDIVF